MDGLLVIDKPAGLTSHDVVARARRILQERRVGHTGTLDPAATGVLPLVVGRATRLARFLSASDKSYTAVIVLGVATDTADASGTPIRWSGHAPMPSREAVDRCLDTFRGTFMQQPPRYSAKKIGGKRSYALARAERSDARTRPGQEPPSPVETSVPRPDLRPRPVSVTAHRIDIVDFAGDRVTVQVDCSAGFYLRALAHDLGERLGIGAHLSELRRTRSGDCSLQAAMTLEAAEEDPANAARRIIPLAGMLAALPAFVLTPDGVRRAVHGRDLRLDDVKQGLGAGDWSYVRLLDPAGELVGIAEPVGAGGLLHPSVVLV